jgi:hypothetical protein
MGTIKEGDYKYILIVNRRNNNKENMRIRNAILISDLLKIITMVELARLQINEVIIILYY